MSGRFGGGEELARWPKERPGKSGSTRAANRKKRLEAFCEAGVKLFLQRGIEGVTVEQIAREAGVAKASFYRYFQGKEELVQVIFAPLADGVLAMMAHCEEALAAATSPTELFQAYTELGQGLSLIMLPYLDLIRLYLQESKAPAVGARAPLRAISQALFEQAFRLTEAAHLHGLLRPFSPKVSTLIVIGAVERLLFELLDGNLDEPPEQIAAALISIILDGMRVSPEKTDSLTADSAGNVKA